MSNSKRPSDDTSSQKFNYAMFVVNGGLTALADRFASPQVVLPWIYNVIGGPLLLIGLLIPSVRIGTMLSQVAVLPTLRALAIRKGVYVTAGLGLAGLLVLIMFAVLELPVLAATILFFACALGLGACQGTAELTSQEVMAKTIQPVRIPRLLATQGSIGGFLALSLALSIYILDPYSGTKLSHLVLIGVAAFTWMVAAASFAVIREPPSQTTVVRSIKSELRSAVSLFQRERWFRRFAMTRVLFLSVGLATPFYAIHAASLYPNSAGNLSLFVIATGVANLSSGLVWGKLLEKSPRLVLVCCGLLATIAGAVAMVHFIVPGVHRYYLYAIVFALLALAVQGLVQASRTYVMLNAPAEERPLYLAANNTIVGLFAIFVSSILGVVAHMSHIFWAFAILMLLSVLASTSAWFMISPGSGASRA